MNKFYYKIVFCFCFSVFSLAFAADISVEGINDKTNVYNDVTFRIESEPEYSYSSFLDDKLIPEDKWITVSQPGYHKINVTGTNGQTTSTNIQFNIYSKERGNPEWGLFPWTPPRPIESSSNECKSANLLLVAPSKYPSESPIPLVAIMNDQSGQWKRINGYVRIDDLNNSYILLKRGVGYTFLSETNAGTSLNLNPAIKSSGTNIFIQIDASQNWSTVSSDIITDTVWSENSRIMIVNDIEIDSGVSLTVEPGCIIFLEPTVNIIVNGDLEINGSLEKPVVFAPKNKTAPWGGFIFSNSVSTANINGAIFTGSGAIKNWMSAHGYRSHRQEQALFLLDSISKVTLSNVFIIDNSGQAFHGQNAGLNAFNCLIQKCTTVGQFNSSTCSFYNSAMIDFPYYDDTYSDADNDGIYMTEGVLQLNNSLIGWAKDDGIDAGSGGYGKVDLINCWIESCFHEGGAFSSHPGTKTINIIDSVFMNNGQGIEAGYGSPFVYVNFCLLINNEIGLRFGDNYPWSQNGLLNVSNSVSIFNYKDCWNMCHDIWSPRLNSTHITGNIFSKFNPDYSNNEVWNSDIHINKLIPFIQKASALGSVGIGFSTSLSNYINDNISVNIPVDLSMVSTNSITVDYLVIGITNSSSRILDNNSLKFAPGEFSKVISFSMKNYPYETVPERIEILLTKSLNAEISQSQNLSVYFITNMNQLIISELHYNPLSSQSNECEFIELYNSGWDSIDFSNFFLNEYTFPTNETLESGEFIVIAKNASYYSNQCSHLLQWSALTLSDTGQTVSLLDLNSNVIDCVTYSNVSPWPTEPDGNGPSLELINVYEDNALPESWAPSDYDGGTPGEHRVIPEPFLFINCYLSFVIYYFMRKI